MLFCCSESRNRESKVYEFCRFISTENTLFFRELFYLLFIFDMFVSLLVCTKFESPLRITVLLERRLRQNELIGTDCPFTCTETSLGSCFADKSKLDPMVSMILVVVLPKNDRLVPILKVSFMYSYLILYLILFLMFY